MHAAALARELRVKKVIIPTEPGVFSAWGMLMTDLRQDLIRTSIRRTDRMEPVELSTLFGDMEAQAGRDLQAQGVAVTDIYFQRFADMRYKGQEHTVKASIPNGDITSSQLRDIDELFHLLHEQAYAFRLDAPIELVNYHLTAFGAVEKVEMRKVEGGFSLEAARKGDRQVHFDEFGHLDTPIYERDRSAPGDFPSPALGDRRSHFHHDRIPRPIRAPR